jgi:hypothetical protein
VAGGVTGKWNNPTAEALSNPTESIGGSTNSRSYAAFKTANERNPGVGVNPRPALQGTVGNIGANDVVSLGGHANRGVNGIEFSDTGAHLISGPQIVADLGGHGFQGKGIDLTAVCYPAENGLARTLATGLNKPVRAAWTSTYTFATGRTVAEYGFDIPDSLGSVIKAPIRTYYPSKLTTGWVALFGY